MCVGFGEAAHWTARLTENLPFASLVVALSCCHAALTTLRQHFWAFYAARIFSPKIRALPCVLFGCVLPASIRLLDVTWRADRGGRVDGWTDGQGTGGPSVLCPSAHAARTSNRREPICPILFSLLIYRQDDFSLVSIPDILPTCSALQQSRGKFDSRTGGPHLAPPPLVFLSVLPFERLCDSFI